MGRGQGHRRATASQEGIETCADVRAYDIFEFVQKFGQFGDHIHQASPTASTTARWFPSGGVQSVSVENTYDQDLPDLRELPAQSCRRLLESLQPRLR